MKWHVQFSRYTVVGLTTNAVGYLLYLLLTDVGVGHKAAMTLLYALGMFLTFSFNRNWSFGNDGRASSALVRYSILHAVGYMLNLIVIMFLVDILGWPHRWVMGSLVIIMAAFFFLAQKFWVFRNIVELGDAQ